MLFSLVHFTSFSFWVGTTDYNEHVWYRPCTDPVDLIVGWVSGLLIFLLPFSFTIFGQGEQYNVMAF
jgi:hypothetical protein